MRRRIRILLLVVLCLFTGCTVASSQSEEPDIAIPEEFGQQEVVIAVVGDLMVHQEQLWSAYDPATGEYDFTTSFAWVAEDITAADLVIGNLETVFAGEEAEYGGYPRFNTPDSFAVALKEAGFDFLSTANNHCMDQGEEGLLRTLQVLDQAGLGHTGTFSNTGEARVSVLDVNGVRIAIAAFTYGVNDIPMERPGLVNRLDRETVAAVMRQAQAQHADWIIVLPHMGEEYAPEPGPLYREWAGYLLATGADGVFAAHPHVLQPMEIKRSPTEWHGLMAYSLGNFLSFQQEPPRDTGILLKLRIVKRSAGSVLLREVSILPVWTQHRDTSGQYLARVIPIYDAIRDYEEGNSLGLRQQDYTRLLEAHAEVTELYLEEPVNRHNLQREYTLYTWG